IQQARLHLLRRQVGEGGPDQGGGPGNLGGGQGGAGVPAISAPHRRGPDPVPRGGEVHAGRAPVREPRVPVVAVGRGDRADFRGTAAGGGVGAAVIVAGVVVGDRDGQAARLVQGVDPVLLGRDEIG